MTNRIAVSFPYSFVIRHSCFVIESIHIPLIPLLILQLLNVFVGLLNAFAALLLNDLAQRRIDVLCHPARIAAHKKVCALGIDPFPNFRGVFGHLVLHVDLLGLVA